MHEHESLRSVGSNVRCCEIGLTLACGVSSCSVVCSDSSSSVKHLTQHIKEGMSIECPFMHCSKKYFVRSSFICHLTREHANWTTCGFKADMNCDGSSASSLSNVALTGSSTLTSDVPNADGANALKENFKKLCRPVGMFSG